MAKQYRTALIIEGDASGGIKAIQATEKELGELNRRFDTGGKRAKQFAQDVDGTSRELEFLKNSAMSVGAALAGAFAVNNIAGQAKMIQQTDALANSLTVSTQTLQQWQYAGQKVGLEADKVGDIFKDVSDKIGDFAATGGGEAKDLFENLNLNIRELQSLSPDQQILKIADAVNKLEDPSQRTFYFESLADEMVRLQPLLANGAQGLRDAAAEADALGVAMSEMDIHRAVEAAHAMEQLQGVATGLSNTLIADLGPGLADATSDLTTLIEKAGGADEVLDVLMTTVGTLATVYLARRLGPGLLTVGKNGVAAGGQIAQGMAVALGATGRLNQALVVTQGRIAATRAASTALRGSLALLGGPAGVAILAAGALYTYHEELDAMLAPAQRATQRVNDLTNAINLNSEAAIKGQLVNLTAEMVKLEQQATSAKKRLDEIKESSNDYGPQQNSMVLGQDADERRAAYETLQKTREKLDANGQAAEKLRARLQKLSDQGVETVNTVSDLGTANDDAAPAAEKFDDSLRSLLDRLDPLAKSQREFTRDNAALQTALLSGRITTEEYFESIKQLEQSYRNASSAAEVYGFTGTKAMDDVADAADPMATAIERSVERLDDSFVDFWENTLSGAENTFDSFKDLAISTLAEIIHAYTTRQITASLGASLSVDGSGGGATGQSGGLGDLSSIGSNVYQGVVDGFGSINWMGNPTSYSGGWAGSATAGMNSGGSFLSNGSMSNFSGMQGLAALPASMVGNYVGSNLGESLTGKQANSNIGATAGAAIGTFFGGPIGAFAGSTLGSFLDSAFGSSGPELDLALQRGDVASYETGDWDHGLRAQSALGTVGFNGTNSHDINATWGHDNAQKALDAIAQLDNVLASLADSPDQLGAMSSAVEGYYGESSSPQKALDALTSRYRQAIDTLDLTFEDTILGFEGSADELVTLASALDGVETSVGDNAQAIADARQALAGSDDLVATAQQLAAQGPALGALAAAADRLNLRFDETASGALAAAGGMAELVGGIDTLAGLQSQYYQAFFSDAEQLEHLQSDLEAQYAELGLTLPDTSAGFRDLVEAQNLMTEAGREQYAALLQLVPAMDQYLSAMDQQAAEVERQRQQISNWLDDLLLSDQSTLAPSERLQESQSQYAATLVRAEAGDADALGNLGSLAQQYLSEAAGYYGQGSSQYGTLFDEIIAAAQGLDGSHANGLASVPWDGYRAELHAGETVLPAPIAQLYRESAPGNNGNGAVVAELQALRRESQQLRDEVRQLRAERAKDADRAAGQRADQLREQQRINRNTKARPSTV